MAALLFFLSITRVEVPPLNLGEELRAVDGPQRVERVVVRRRREERRRRGLAHASRRSRGLQGVRGGEGEHRAAPAPHVFAVRSTAI